MEWDINFISKDNFKKHVANTITKYGEKLKPYDVTKFNSNIIDPIKMIFDKAVYGASWEQIISNEIFRQRDKSNTNEIGYFHQRFFEYIESCSVPLNGHEGGWDIIFHAKDGYVLENGNKVHTIYVEMKNKHNTMNSSASAKTYIKMQNQLLENDDCACFLVEAIAKKSQNIIWSTTVDKKKVSHARIRRVSLDKFYEIVTGEEDAFMKMCMALPNIVQEVLMDRSMKVTIPNDTVFEELQNANIESNEINFNEAMVLSMYMLGFHSYNGFEKWLKVISN